MVGGISCTGAESNLNECSRGQAGQLDCVHRKDAGVLCQGMWMISCALCSSSEAFTLATIPHRIQSMHSLKEKKQPNTNLLYMYLHTILRFHSCSVHSDCGHRSSKGSTHHWVHCESHLPCGPTNSWGGSDLSLERLHSKHISSCFELQPSLCHPLHWDGSPSHSKVLLPGVLPESTACHREHRHQCAG